ncbi:MAG TPA: hypothetical protein VM388_12560 [Acidimicrobiales bacterium]|nr:hypothetical protein [Acidimicrobiales bacterium]
MCSQAGPRRVVAEVPADRRPGTANGGPTDQLLPLVNRVLRPAEVAELRRRVASLPAGCDTGLDPSTAYDVLSQLAELQARRRHGPNRVHCPYCGEGFDIAHGVTTRPPGWRNPPPRHPDPVAASSTLAGAEEATRVLATAMAWGSDRLRGKDAFWVDFGRIVVCPLLHLANITGRDMEELRLWTHPMRVAETMATVATELDALAPGADADRARRQWATIAGQREQARRVAFSYAYGMIRHWELSPAAPSAEAPESGGPAGP